MSTFTKLAAIFKTRTPGPWTSGNGAVWNLLINGVGNSPEEICSYGSEANNRFIAAAGTLADEILAVLEAAEEVSRKYRRLPEDAPAIGVDSLDVHLDALRAAVAKLPEAPA